MKKRWGIWVMDIKSHMRNVLDKLNSHEGKQQCTIDTHFYSHFGQYAASYAHKQNIEYENNQGIESYPESSFLSKGVITHWAANRYSSHRPLKSLSCSLKTATKTSKLRLTGSLWEQKYFQCMGARCRQKEYNSITLYGDDRQSQSNT